MPNIAPKLKAGDEVRVIAPSYSMNEMTSEMRVAATSRLASLGIRISFGEHAEEADILLSPPLQSRIADFHAAFSDPQIKGVFAVTGGFNANELLSHIDWKLVRKHPKVFCGFSDITALSNAIYAKTGLVTYSGPNYRTLRHDTGAEYVLAYLKKCLFEDEPYQIAPSDIWIDKGLRGGAPEVIKNAGWLPIQEGEAEGTIVGGNLCTLNLLQGTPYFPSLKGSILFLEDDSESRPETFSRDLQSLLQTKGFGGVRGLVLGRFERASGMSREKLLHILRTKRELARIPIIADADFGHTGPLFTFPVGGKARITVRGASSSIHITRH